jgi:predicted metal-dependent peptidase
MNEPIKITNSEWQEISFALEDHHAIFYQLWQMGKPIFDREIDTAAVKFNAEGDFIYFHFNPEFWLSLNLKNKLFVICHEALHIILNHGKRIKDSKKINHSAANAALDIVVNHSLIKNFGFQKEDLKDHENYCWIDTIFKDKEPKPSDEETFEYYYNLFDKVFGDGSTDFSLVDNHQSLGDPQEQSQKIIDKLNEETQENEKQSLENFIKKHYHDAGQSDGGWQFIKKTKIIKKKKWESVIKKWSKKYLSDQDAEQWTRLNRRLNTLPNDIFLPSDMEIENTNKNKIKVWFYLDTSGSCFHLKERFFTAASSLSKTKFDVRLFCFDTKVYETSLSTRKIYGGGGTSFNIIEKQIQNEIRLTNKKYPDAVFVLTDGFGDNIHPEKPQNWHWFLVNHSTTNYIPRQSHIFNLLDYE